MSVFLLYPSAASTQSGSVTETIVRLDAIQSVAPTIGEFAAPTTRDRAVVALSDGSTEYWTFASGVWSRIGVTLGAIEVQLVTAVPVATATSPKVAINTTDSRVYFRDDLGGGVFVYTEIRTNPAADEVSLVNSIPTATAVSPEFIINITDGKAYYLDDLGGGVYVYTQITA